jgi:WD40 repeat protein
MTDYQIGGSLPFESHSYVTRSADAEFYDALSAGEFCYVLNSRQMGKSSLRVRVMQQLQSNGVVCGFSDLTGIGKVDSEDKWYAGIVKALVSSCKLTHKIQWRTWWKQQQDLTSPSQRLREFIEEILLVEIQSPIVLFIDEIDRVLSQEFSLDDFFALIRYFYNRRVDHPVYKRLTFALLGVATPSNLIRDKTCTCFNIGRAIHLEGFYPHEVAPLTQGLLEFVENPQAVIQEVLYWTNGQPFLTQKVCQLIVQTSRNYKFTSVETVIQKQIIEDWESQDEPQHLRTIRDRILRDENRSGRLLSLFQQILQQGELEAGERPEQWELQLSGLVVKQQGRLKIYNPIYAEIFDSTWVQKQLDSLRPYAMAYSIWIDSKGNDESRLLRGQALRESLDWSHGRNLSEQDYHFLNASQSLENRELDSFLSAQQQVNFVLQEANEVLQKANLQAKQRISLGVAVLATTLALATGIGIWAGTSVTQAERKVKIANQKVAQSVQEFQNASEQVIEERKNLKNEEFNVQKVKSKLKALQSNLTLLNKQALRDRQVASQAIKKSQGDLLRSQNQKKVAEQSISQINRNLSQKNKDLAKAQIATLVASKKLSIAQKEQQEVRIGTRLERSGNTALRQFQFQQNEALLTAVSAGRELQNIVKDGRPLSEYPAVSPIFSLKYILDNIYEKTQLNGHKENVEDLHISPDGKLILTASTDRTAKVWSVTGQLLHTLKGHQDTIKTAIFSPDGQSILTASYDRTIKLWSLDGHLQKNLIIFNLDPKEVQFSPDGKSILAPTTDYRIWLWDFQGKVLAKLVHAEQIMDAKFSADGQQVVTISTDNMTRIWTLQGHLKTQFPEPTALIPHSSSEVSHNGQYLITKLNDLSTSFRNFSGQEIFQILGHYRLHRFTPNGQALITLSVDEGMVHIWNLQNMQSVSFQTGHQGFIQNIQINQSSNLLVTTAADKTAKVWTFKGELLATLSSHEGMVYSAQFVPNQPLLVTVATDKTPRIWHLKSPVYTRLVGHQFRVRRASFSPDGQRIITASDDKTARIWDLNGKMLDILEGHQGFVRRASFSPDGQRIVTASDDTTARLWNLQGNGLAQMRGHTKKVYDAQFSPDGQKIVTASEDHTARLWNSKGELLALLQGHQGVVWGAQFSPDGQRILTASDDHTAKLWNLHGNLLVDLTGHQDIVWSAQFSPNGQWIITASQDRTARLWDRQGKLITTLTGHQDALTSAQFSPNGKWIVTTSKDKTARLWTAEGTLHTKLQGHYDVINSAQFSPDSQRIITASNDGTGKMWDIHGNLLEDLRDHQVGLWNAQFSPDGQRVVTASLWRAATIWPVQDLNQLLAIGCDWLQDYLMYSAAATDSDHQLCNLSPRRILPLNRALKNKPPSRLELSKPPDEIESDRLPQSRWLRQESSPLSNDHPQLFR